MQWKAPEPHIKLSEATFQQAGSQHWDLVLEAKQP